MTASRPDAILGVFDRPFWEFLQQRELRLQRCDQGHFRFPPGPVCPSCGSVESSWEPVSGKGKMVTWTEFHRQYFPQMPPPYIVVCAQLEEGPLLVADFVGAQVADLSIGMGVRLNFHDVTMNENDRVIYQWIPTPSTE